MKSKRVSKKSRKNARVRTIGVDEVVAIFDRAIAAGGTQYSSDDDPLWFPEEDEPPAAIMTMGGVDVFRSVSGDLVSSDPRSEAVIGPVR